MKEIRLIDADALKNDILKSAVMIDDRGIQTGYEIAIELIKRQPTIDAEPVRHGKWTHEVRYTIDSLHSYQQYRCSECGMTYITNTKYCPSCGARMVEDE